MVLILGLLLLLIVLANIIQARDTKPSKLAFKWLLLVLNLLVFVIGLLFLLISPTQLSEFIETDLLSVPIPTLRTIAVVLLLTAVWSLVVTIQGMRRLLARWLPLDPTSPVHTLALILAAYLVANSAITLTQGGLEGLLETATETSIAQVLTFQLYYAAIGLAGIGLLIRRNGSEVIERLGLEQPTVEQLTRSLRWVGILLILQMITGLVFTQLNPEQAEVLDDLNKMLLGNIDTLWEWFLLALSSGVAEEILFRGAIQPVFGLWVTAFLFAFSHIQYGLTPATLLVFIVGVILGLVRRRYSTTAAIFVHFSYNFVLGIFSLLAPYLERMAG